MRRRGRGKSSKERGREKKRYILAEIIDLMNGYLSFISNVVSARNRRGGLRSNRDLKR